MSDRKNLFVNLDFESIEDWLRCTDDEALKELFRTADEIRVRYVGDEVHLRGLIEISNWCIRKCWYCGLNVSNRKVARYRLNHDSIMDCVHRAKEFGCGTVVLQSGEDPEITQSWIVDLIKLIKRETDLAVTLSLGEKPEDDMRAFKNAGADRYLMRFETSDKDLIAKIHPPSERGPFDRITCLRLLKKLGYEIGSGVMIGIPGQTYRTLAYDIAMFAELDSDMIGVGPFIPHPETHFVRNQIVSGNPEQVPNNEMMTYKVMALARLVCPEANIPATTALATLNREQGRELGLQRGANVIMPNFSPADCRSAYEIYPNKACNFEIDKAECECIKNRILKLGRSIGKGQGGRKYNSPC